MVNEEKQTKGSTHIRKNRVHQVIYFLLLSFFAAFSFGFNLNISPALDDWSWGTAGTFAVNPHNILSVAYAGRFTGNFFEIILSQSRNIVLSSAFKTIILLLVIHFFVKTISIILSDTSFLRKIEILLLVVTLFLTINMNTLQQVFIWQAGTVNYLLPFALVLPVMAHLADSKKAPLIEVLLYGFLVFLAMLCLENFSTTLFVFLFLFTIIEFFRNRVRAYHVLYLLLCSTLGFLVLMLNSTRLTAAETAGYHLDNVSSGKIFSLTLSIWQQIFQDQMVLVSLMLIGLVLVVLKEKHFLTLKNIGWITLGVALSYFALAQLAIVSPQAARVSRTSIVSLMIVIFMVAIFLLKLKLKAYLAICLLVVVSLLLFVKTSTSSTGFIAQMSISQQELKNIALVKKEKKTAMVYPLMPSQMYLPQTEKTVLSSDPIWQHAYLTYYHLPPRTKIIPALMN